MRHPWTLGIKYQRGTTIAALRAYVVPSPSQTARATWRPQASALCLRFVLKVSHVQRGLPHNCCTAPAPATATATSAFHTLAVAGGPSSAAADCQRGAATVILVQQLRNCTRTTTELLYAEDYRTRFDSSSLDGAVVAPRPEIRRAVDSEKAFGGGRGWLTALTPGFGVPPPALYIPNRTPPEVHAYSPLPSFHLRVAGGRTPLFCPLLNCDSLDRDFSSRIVGCLPNAAHRVCSQPDRPPPVAARVDTEQKSEKRPTTRADSVTPTRTPHPAPRTTPHGPGPRAQRRARARVDNVGL